jgi:hypothetical protein
MAVRKTDLMRACSLLPLYGMLTSPYAVIPDAAKRRSGIGELGGRPVKLPDSGFGCAAPE